MHEIIYGDKKSSEYGIYITGNGVFDAPERDITPITIPGRSGTLTIDNKRFNNIVITYPAFIYKDFMENAQMAKEWLLMEPGYRRLEDTYNKDCYRMARFIGPINFSMRELNHSGEFNLSFDCMPQKFLKSGEEPIEITEEIILTNPSPFPAKAIIRVFGTDGTVFIGNKIIIMNQIDEYVDIDCDSGNAYKETENKNKTVLTDFPEIPAGSTGIKFEGNITKTVIWPRWWSI